MIVRFYRVNGYEDKSDTHKYGRHLCIGVVAVSAMKAITTAQEMYPRARLDAVNDCGIVNAVVDSPETVTEPK